MKTSQESGIESEIGVYFVECNMNIEPLYGTNLESAYGELRERKYIRGVSITTESQQMEL